MQITGDYQLAASPENVWRAIHDDIVLQRCIPGCKSIERLSEDQLRAVVTTKVGPVSATLKGLITFSEQTPPKSLYLTGSGDGGIVGFAKGGARVTLEAVPDGTHLNYEIDVAIGGKLAQLGQRLLAGTAKKNSDIFFSNLVAYFNESIAATEAVLK
ncbi:MAG: carbon monoxide dehydrogenase subunit G [Rhizobiales bacterium]|nr:carbon monoxide dehydrogenase subunit G [Hyphomicrobiales bacterium]